MSAASRLPRVAVATANPGKIREIRAILDGSPVEIVGPDPAWVPPPEDADSYLGNARIKARSLAPRMGIPVLADDSGIEVDALGGAPGLHSARLAGEDASDEENLRAILDALRDVPDARRTARYRCLALLVVPASGGGGGNGPDAGPGREVVCEATVEGRLILKPRGEGGFGYDPIFVPGGETRTMAELDPAEKDRLSHRGRAFRGLAPALRTLAPGSRARE